jgi:carboxypeptidase PM20D1
VKQLAGALLLAVIVIVAVLVVNTGRVTSRQVDPVPAPTLALDETAATTHLAGAIRFRTVTSDGEARVAPDTWPTFHAYLAGIYPLIEKNLQREAVANDSLLYTWTGRRPELPPVILTGHMDVVPAADDTLAQWTHPPFAGVVTDDAIWGSGSLDDKNAVIGVLEAVEALLAGGFTPERTIYLAFGHDEEAGAGSTGATAIAALLKSRGVQNAVVLDEGGWIFDKIPGVSQRVALIGLAEKGFFSAELTVTTKGGHSSMPPRETAIGILSRAVERAESHPMPPRLDGAGALLFDTLAPEMSYGMRLVFANRWLTNPLLLRQLASQPTTDATIRTTTATTMMRAGAKENVLASSASAVMNFRLMPGDTADTVMAHLTKVIDDPRVTIAPYRGNRGDDASPVSSAEGPQFTALSRAIRSVFPSALVAPYLTLGATDARHYTGVATHIYRFVPVDQPGGTDLLHAPNEHILRGAYLNEIRAFAAIITELSKQAP